MKKTIVFLLGWILGSALVFSQPKFQVDSVSTDSIIKVYFKDLSKNPGSWKWTLGNGETSTEQHPVVIYPGPGHYQVVLRIGKGIKDTVKHDLFLGVDETKFTADTTDGQWPRSLTVHFTDKTQGAVGWDWDFGAGQHSTEQNPTVKFKKLGKHTVTLTTKYENGEYTHAKKKLIAYKPFFTNDAIVLGLLLTILGLVFLTASSERPGWKKFYTFVPPLLLCYFLPALLNWPFKLIHEDFTLLYNPMASRYLLPASLVLLCLSIDFKGLINLGPKALIMFLAATLGIIIGGPIALLIVSTLAPDTLGADPGDLWRGLATIAGGWIGGGGNSTAMKEIYNVSDKMFSSMVVIDIVVGNIWMGFLLYGASISKKVDKWFKADSSAIDDLKNRVEQYSASIARIPSATDIFMILAVGFGATALGHMGAGIIEPIFSRMNAESISDAYPFGKLVAWGLSSLTSKFFWLIVIATTIGLILSFTRLRKLEGAGASKFGSVFIYILVATIGMRMNIGDVFDNLGAFSIGIIWMLVHITILLGVAKLIRAPFFFVAVGSQANVGGAASAPVVASAFSPALAPVGVLMAVLGYAFGTYGAIICAWLMELASKGM